MTKKGDQTKNLKSIIIQKVDDDVIDPPSDGDEDEEPSPVKNNTPNQPHSSLKLRELVQIAKDIYAAQKKIFQPSPSELSNANNQPLNPQNHLSKLLEHNRFTDLNDTARLFWVALADGVDCDFLDVHTSTHGRWSTKTKAFALQSMHQLLQDAKVKADFQDNIELYSCLISCTLSKSKELMTQYHKEYKDGKSTKPTQDVNILNVDNESIQDRLNEVVTLQQENAKLTTEVAYYKGLAEERYNQVSYLQSLVDKTLSIIPMLGRN